MAAKKTSKTAPKKAATKAAAPKRAAKKAAAKKTATKSVAKPSGPQAGLATAADILEAAGDRRCWLAKSEPDVYSIQQLAKDGSTTWEGVRNYQARNFMRDQMRVGDLVLFYHSNAEPPGIAGVARVSKDAYPDPFQFDPKSHYYDAGSKKADPRWVMVEVEHVETFDEVLSLDALKADAALETMLVVRKGQRLSVQPVDQKHFARVLSLAGAKTHAS